eukprot:CAMPEP_0204574690 /NCGR_PEP_ID=MMETSP0661-20131031/40750_1 /ASSEMBLY_ACC=CAM_ASM_000606 /TAXON_ID=109239 /ORGANISM="Alexandrium margalefi, Strain AMGDE01CS-322" /LENGTH=267 /DNA_ID=CAMNT_0051583241 /DNA_START=108 /DNA_END=908 /DNA_ORIENTATION=+
MGSLGSGISFLTLFAGALHRPAGQSPLKRQALRREFIVGAASTASSRLEDGQELHALQDHCDCCKIDWCHCGPLCDCSKVLKSMGYTVPLDAQTAYLEGGELLSAAVLQWRSGHFPSWNPVSNDSLEIKNSTLRDAGQGLFAASRLEKGSVLPPYQGLILTKADLTRVEYASSESNYVWCPQGSTFQSRESDLDVEALPDLTSTFCVDGELSMYGNPARFVNGARTAVQCLQVNMEICELGNVAYFRTTRDVAPGTELLVNYGRRYW